MKWLAFYISVLLVCKPCDAQPQAFNFHKLGLRDGLQDGTVRCIGQDKFGYIWIGSVSALNRFDGKNIVHYTNIPADTSSPYGSQPRCIHSDQKGRLWIGFETGLAEYDFEHNSFRRIPALKDVFVGNITSFNDSVIYLATRRGLVRYNTNNGYTFYYADSHKPQHAALANNAVFGLKYKKNQLYLATNKGLVMMDPVTEETKKIEVKELGDMPIYSVDLDSAGNIWMGSHQEIKLMKLHPDLRTLEVYDQFLKYEAGKKVVINVMSILVDKKNTVWTVTTNDGLLQYQPATNQMIRHSYQGNLPSSPSGNNYRSIFQDDKDIIWLGCDFFGVNFFEPERFLFETILPFPELQDVAARGIGRAVAEDKQGNIWMGNHYGVTRYDPNTQSYIIWRNEPGKPEILYSNVVRSMYCDADNNIWIGTGSGVNRFNGTTKKMEFIPAEDLPLGFYNSITGDREGNIWFCLNDTEVLFWYDSREKQYHNIGSHPQLKPYKSLAGTSYAYEDSKRRLWISFGRKGVIMLDKKTGQVKQFIANEKDSNSIIGNQIIDIKEDKKGVIWLTTFNGITGIDTEKGTFTSFNNKNGMPGNWSSPLEVDSLDRIWLGTNGGLMMLNKDRKQFTRFTQEDGLPSIGFPEHAGITTANGDIIFPTYRGYIRFNPLRYKETAASLRFYLGSYSVFDKVTLPPASMGDSLRIDLKPADNSFTFNLVAINYLNPHQTWFAYKLEGFDKNWHFTQDPKAVYTNVPGGRYTFLFKASVNNSEWEKINPRQLDIHLQTAFYKTIWFWGLLVALIVVGFWWFYRFRLAKQSQILDLKTKTESLEKEKAMIQYESLKQHLNPHFLFNSLTSLRSLIKTDSKTAARFLDGMSKVYRYVLKSGGQELVLLQDEIDFVKTFAELQQVRFGKGLVLTISIRDQDMQKVVAPVVLQNLVENAIKHNTTSLDSPLVINIFSEYDHLVVRNNLQRYRLVETSNKSGLASLKKLYSFYTDQEIKIEESDTSFTVRIPLL